MISCVTPRLSSIGKALQLPRLVRFFLLGHSHGGLIATAGAIRGRLKATGFILASPFLHSKVLVPRSKRLLAAIAGQSFPGFGCERGCRTA